LLKPLNNLTGIYYLSIISEAKIVSKKVLFNN
jgi:hypothetical protein